MPLQAREPPGPRPTRSKSASRTWCMPILLLTYTQKSSRSSRRRPWEVDKMCGLQRSVDLCRNTSLPKYWSRFGQGHSKQTASCAQLPILFRVKDVIQDLKRGENDACMLKTKAVIFGTWSTFLAHQGTVNDLSPNQTMQPAHGDAQVNRAFNCSSSWHEH